MSAEESTGAPATTATLPPGGPHFLESEWVIWEHRSPDKNSKSYEDNMEKLCDISTVEDFWRAWNNIPKPSAVFFDGRTRKRFANRQVESFSLFKKNIKPEWEDQMNRNGAEWFARKTFPGQQLVSLPTAQPLRPALRPSCSALALCVVLAAVPQPRLPHALQDDFWLSLALGMIGETLDPGDEVCGARVVDKSTTARQMFRLELWFKKKDQTIADELLGRMNTCLGPAAKSCKWEFRPH